MKRTGAAMILLGLMTLPAKAIEPPDGNRHPGWHNRMQGYQAVREPRWKAKRQRAIKRHAKPKRVWASHRRPAARLLADGMKAAVTPVHKLVGVVAPLVSKAHELIDKCGARVISGQRRTYVRGSGRRSLHWTGRAIDISGNPSCMYALLRGWPGGVSTDYHRVNHIHISYAPKGPEWGRRFAHYRGARKRRYASR